MHFVFCKYFAAISFVLLHFSSFLYIYKVFKEKTKTNHYLKYIGCINSFSSASHFSLMIHFKMNLQVIININERHNSDDKIFKKEVVLQII